MEPLKELVVYLEKEKTVTDDGSTVYELAANNRDAGNQERIKLGQDDQMQFVFSDGTTWVNDPSTLHELFPEADPAVAKFSGDRSAGTDGFELPGFIQAPTTERGIASSIALKLSKVIVKKAVSEGIGNLAERLENEQLKHGIAGKSSFWNEDYEKEYLSQGAGLFNINKNFGFDQFSPKPSNNTFFLFIHGTNSDTFGAFFELSKSSAWPTLHTIYDGNVIAFQHRTLTESPLENAVKLVNLLPDNAVLHIISHSRGGIVGDIMCKYSTINGKPPVGFTEEHIQLLKKETGRERDIENIKTLNKIFQTKQISVTKFIRVACPAAGTKLASKRLDHILNVFSNLLSLLSWAAVPYGEVVVKIFKELLSAAVSTKDNVDVLPGIEAQSPGSPFIKILNDQSENSAIDGGSLAVISGNGTVSVSGNGLLVILGKLFYWQRNDLVVNTDSMYLGVKRQTNIQYFFDQGADVNHIKYFSNAKTCDVINLALKSPAGNLIPGFKSIMQNEIPSTDRDDRGLDHGELFPAAFPAPGGKRPIVILIPGIMGSNLSKNEGLLWLNYWGALVGGLTKLEYAEDKNISATSIVKSSYNRLASWLSAKYDVVIFPFDWRKQLNECAKELDSKIQGLLTLGQPIKIIGHSMGGVLARDFIINHDDTWQKLNKSKGFRLLFLGAPLWGSFRIPAVLFGQDSIIDALNILDRVHTKKELLEMFSKFPGILSLLPLATDSENDFADMATWEKMRDVINDDKWPLPDKNDLSVFMQYRNKIIEKSVNIDYTNLVYIAGKDKQTPCGYFKDEIPPRRELVFLYTTEGDQSVTWESGIPEQLKKANAVYYVQASHGALANEPQIFDGIEDILSTGATTRLNKSPQTSRGEVKIFRGQPDTNFDLSERGFENAILGIGKDGEPVSSRVPVSVSVSNGDLCYATYPILAGHFVNDGILYAEKVIDDYSGGMLRAKHQLGLYPGHIGTNDVFNRDQKNGFGGAVVVGLGEPGSLTSFQLAKTIEQGVSNYLLSIKGQPVSKKGVGISALIIGCGYGGLTIESSVKAVIEGVNEANEKAIRLFKNNGKTIQYIEFVEVYSYRALSCMYALNRIESKENSIYNIVIGSKEIKNLLGIRKRIPLDSTDEWWNRITVKYSPGAEGEPSGMVFGASTGDAREEEDELYSSTPLIDLFISEISIKNQWSAATAKTLFELMIPNKLKETLKQKGNISWILDTNTAAYPWELLQDNTINAKPLCINAGMIRQLSTSDYRINIKRVAEEKALIIADPVLNGFIGQLPGARQEGQEVENALKTIGYPTTSIINKEAAEIVRNFFSEDYNIIHLAGHGVFNAKTPNKSGMVIGKDVFLTVFDIQQMPVVPELVFVNCCHLGNINAADEKYYQDRYKLAANIGTELIKIGVKAVIAAGWAVNDSAALEFANTFYSAMFAGNTFGDAVKKARAKVYEKHLNNNTWGAYQCYGDPFFKLKAASKTRMRSAPSYIVPEEAEIDLDNLLNGLQMGKKSKEENIAELNMITEAIEAAKLFKTYAPIVEKQALIFSELGLYEESIEKFDSLLKIENANFSFSSMEKYCNVRAKLLVKQYFAFQANGQSDKSKIDELINSMQDAIKGLEMLCDAGETVERLNLLGSTYKRKAMLIEDKGKRNEAFNTAAEYYECAYKKDSNKNKVYSLTNAIEIREILRLGGELDHADEFKREVEALAALKEEISKKDSTDNIDYWDMVAAANIKLCQLLTNEKPALETSSWDEIRDDFNNIWNKAGSLGKRSAEREHFQFLAYSFSKVNGNGHTVVFKSGDNEDEKGGENLEAIIGQLRTAYQNAIGKNGGV